MRAVPTIQVVDLEFDGSTLTIRWPGSSSRIVDDATIARVATQVARLADVEVAAGLRRDVVPLSPALASASELAVAQRGVGELLYDVLDGPERTLTASLEEVRRDGRPFHLVVRLRTTHRKSLGRHPALRWPVQLLCSDQGPLALEPDVAIALQLGNVDVSRRETVVGDRLDVLFMAYAPRDVLPVLDYEREEERVLAELEPFIDRGRLILKVAEEGTLQELRRRLKERRYDVVHLVGHGIMTANGPRLLMEAATGDRDDVDADRLLEALRAGQTAPRLLVISSCYSADQPDELPSLAAELILGGVPTVIGWTRPVRDDVAIHAAAVLYERLCSGELAIEAVAGTRRALHRTDEAREEPTHAWATLQMLTARTPGFAIDPTVAPLRDDSPSSGAAYRMLGNRISVLTTGFVGRRRELQALGRILRRGRWTSHGSTERAVAGALVLGMKGQGKSCLIARALDRHQQDSDQRGHVVLHGELDARGIVTAFRTAAIGIGDYAAEKTLEDESRTIMARVEKLLRHHWRDRRLAIILDDFEQNLVIPTTGDACLSRIATELLAVLLPACLDESPKVLMTSTARFKLDNALSRALAEIPLGALDGASVRKLWARGQPAELSSLRADEWARLSERFGRNARILDWARQLLAGDVSDEVRTFMADDNLSDWKGQPLDDSKQDALAAAFQRHMALADAETKVGPHAITFVERARVYDVPVPLDALVPLAAGLELPVSLHVAALANLGLLERSGDDGCFLYRVSPLVRHTFRVADGGPWHGVAAEYWWRTARVGEGWQRVLVMRAWKHALAAKRADIANATADLLGPYLDGEGDYTRSVELAMQHIEVFPSSVAGLNWHGYALYRAGRARDGLAVLERALMLIDTNPADSERRLAVTYNVARVLVATNSYGRARPLLEALVDCEEALHPEGSPRLALMIYTLAEVLHGQADLSGARAILERALELWQRLRPTEISLHVAAVLHLLAEVVSSQGDLAGARAHFERSLHILRTIRGGDIHPDVGAALHSLGRVLHAQSDLAGARAHFEQSEAILRGVHGTEDHPNIAACHHELGRVLLSAGDLVGARTNLERSLAIKRRLHGPDEPLDLAATLVALGGVFLAQKDARSARTHIEHALAIHRRIHGTDRHPDVAVCLHELGRVLRAQGDVGGARARLEEALAIHHIIHGNVAHPHIAAALHELGGIHLALGERAVAREYLERALAMLRDVHGDNPHGDVAVCLHELGSLAYADEDCATARELFDQSLTLKRRIHGDDAHLDIAASLQGLARVLVDQGHLAQARAHVDRSIAIEQALLGNEHDPRRAAGLVVRARVLTAQRDLAGARSDLERALALLEAVHGASDHREVAAVLTQLGDVLLQQGDYGGAGTAIDRSLAMKRRMHGTDDHVSIALSLRELGRVLLAQNQPKEARVSLEAALDILRKQSASKRASIAHVLRELARALLVLGDLAAARTRIDEALSLLGQIHGTVDHPDIAAALCVAAAVLDADGDRTGAAGHVERAAAILRNVHGTDEDPKLEAWLKACEHPAHAPPRSR